MLRKRTLRRYLLLACVAILLGAIGLLLGANPFADEPPPVSLLPDLEGYRTVEADSLIDYVSRTAEGAALLAGQPELVAAIAVVEQVISCYEQLGVVQARVYSDEANPLSAGIVASANRNELLDPQNLFACVRPAVPDLPPDGGVPFVQPCLESYTISREDNELYVIYAGTTDAICQAICAGLEGCPATP